MSAPVRGAGVEHAPPRMVYCPRCAAALHTGAYQGKPRRRCAACGFIHFVEPKVAVAGMVLQAGALLLVQRAVNPEKGKWSLPAGYLDLGETPQAGVAREVLEETGLEVGVGRLVDAYYNPPGQGATIILVYRARWLRGTLAAADDATDARFFTPDALPPLAFDSTRDVARRAARMLRRAARINA